MASLIGVLLNPLCLQRVDVCATGVPQVRQAPSRAAGDHHRDRGDRGEVRERLEDYPRGVLPAHVSGRAADAGPTGSHLPQR